MIASVLTFIAGVALTWWLFVVPSRRRAAFAEEEAEALRDDLMLHVREAFIAGFDSGNDDDLGPACFEMWLITDEMSDALALALDGNP